MSDSTLQISCSIGTTDALANLGIEIRLDDQVLFLTTHVIDTIDFKYNMPNVDSEHCLEFIMKHKTAKHTKINEKGNIIKDACLTISNLMFDDIGINQIFINQAVYTHDFNGTQLKTENKFYGVMGCNGTVKFVFSTPSYLWLLENM